MSGSVNKAIIVGNCVRDPEIRNSQDGTKIATLTVATSERWKDRASGEQKERSEFHRVVIFNDRIAEVAEKYLVKGAKVYIEGQLQTRKWTDQQGIERYSTEVVIARFNGQMTMLDTRSGGDGAPRQPAAENRPQGARGWETPKGGGRDLDDEIPFGPSWQ